MSFAWRRADSSRAPACWTATRPRAARSALTRQLTAASTAAGGASPRTSAAKGQPAAACARAGGAASADRAAQATARTRRVTALRAACVWLRTRESAAGPRGGVPGMPGASVQRGRTHKTTLVLRPDGTSVGLVDEPVTARPQRGRQPVPDADVAEDVAQMALDRLRADAQAQGDLLVRHPGADEREHLPLALAHPGGGRTRAGAGGRAVARRAGAP